ncbi:MAG: isoprenyl transferase [Tissierellales bacterium]|nr:isoprenyl transferase [Tissierellales bacterium]MBN2827963.1 isoprenyl transferase [Tissierellales bacterium]
MSDLNEIINKNHMPEHIAIIMDGNRRWAALNKKNKNSGHREGMFRIREIIEECVSLGVRTLTVYAFSTENWGRETEEINYLMNLLLEFTDLMIAPLHDAGIKINVFGDLKALPDKSRKSIQRALEKTKNNNNFTFNIALNYGSRTEIKNATIQISKDVLEKKIQLEDINENLINQYLYSHGQKDPDLLIRTSGEQRLSNFMLYQLAYAEFYFTEVLWPDFTAKELHKAVIEYQNRNRRFGKE